MRVVFMGTPDFAAVALRALLASAHQVICVYSQPPRPAGRGQKPRPSPVQHLAEEHGVEVRTPAGLKDPAAQADVAALGADVGVVAAYGLILPIPILQAPRHGCLNIHASLLPRWRGAAPIHRAVEAGDAETGITIMQMDEGLDTGDMLLARSVPIGPAATTGELHDTLAALGGELIVAALDRLTAGALTATPQPDEGVTYARKIDKAETRLDWRQSADVLARKVRAFAPWPGAFFEMDGHRIRVLAAEATPSPAPDAPPGTVVGDPLVVACGDGALSLQKVQRAGKAPVPADAFRRGYQGALEIA